MRLWRDVQDHRGPRKDDSRIDGAERPNQHWQTEIDLQYFTAGRLFLSERQRPAQWEVPSRSRVQSL